MSIFKGWFGEKKATFWMWLSLNSQVYNRFHNTIIPSSNGTAQIDHILVSRYGIFIVETKNKGGWIFGSENQAEWTQTIYGKKYSFQNPLRQTYRQKKILAQFIQVDVYRIIAKIGQHTNESQISTSDHVRSLHERHSSNTICPKCGSGLKLRVAKNGLRAGSNFLGCENYPRCRFTRNV